MGAGICLQNIILICKNNSDKNIDLLVSTNVIENSILSNCKSKRLLYELVNIIQLLANHSPSPDIFDESWPRTVSGLGGLRNDYVLFTRQITGLKMYTKTVTNILSTPSSPDIENYLTDNTYTIVIHCNTKILQSNFNQWVFIVVESKTKQEQTTLEIGVYMVFFSETALLNKCKIMYKWLERSLWDPTLHKKTLFSNWCWYLHLLSVSWALLSVSWFILRVQPSLSKYTIHYLQTVNLL